MSGRPDDYDDRLKEETDKIQERNDSRLLVLERGSRPWLWPIVSSFLFSFLSAALATGLCLQVSARNAQRGVTQREILQQTADQQHEALCSLIISLDDTAHAVPPTTPLGKAQAQTYLNLRASQGCAPRTGE